MELEWDEGKRQDALLNRGTDFADFAHVDQASLRTWPDRRKDYGEARFISYGNLDDRLHAFCWTRRGNRIRIISMRKANGRERQDMTRARIPGSLEGKLPGESLDDFEKRVGDDIPEATEEDFKRARPISDFPDLLEALNNARARGQRGPQKAEVKDRIGLRLDHSIVEHFRATGPGWQSRINDILAEHVKKQS